MKPLLLIILSVLCGIPAYAHKDRLDKISKAELTFEDGGTIVLTKNRVSVLSLSLRTETGLVEVKKEDLSGIDYPQFDSMQMTWSTFTSGDLAGIPYKIIRFRYGSDKKLSFGDYPEVAFHFYDGKYHHREQKVKVSSDTWRIDSPRRSSTIGILNPKEANRQPEPTRIER